LNFDFTSGDDAIVLGAPASGSRFEVESRGGDGNGCPPSQRSTWLPAKRSTNRITRARHDSAEFAA